ncbi:MAG: hypothetical protein R3F43_31735 [bacterium]
MALLDDLAACPPADPCPRPERADGRRRPRALADYLAPGLAQAEAGEGSWLPGPMAACGPTSSAGATPNPGMASPPGWWPWTTTPPTPPGPPTSATPSTPWGSIPTSRCSSMWPSPRCAGTCWRAAWASTR